MSCIHSFCSAVDPSESSGLNIRPLAISLSIACACLALLTILILWTLRHRRRRVRKAKITIEHLGPEMPSCKGSSPSHDMPHPSTRETYEEFSFGPPKLKDSANPGSTVPSQVKSTTPPRKPPRQNRERKTSNPCKEANIVSSEGADIMQTTSAQSALQQPDQLAGRIPAARTRCRKLRRSWSFPSYAGKQCFESTCHQCAQHQTSWKDEPTTYQTAVLPPSSNTVMCQSSTSPQRMEIPACDKDKAGCSHRMPDAHRPEISPCALVRSSSCPRLLAVTKSTGPSRTSPDGRKAREKPASDASHSVSHASGEATSHRSSSSDIPSSAKSGGDIKRATPAWCQYPGKAWRSVDSLAQTRTTRGQPLHLSNPSLGSGRGLMASNASMPTIPESLGSTHCCPGYDACRYVSNPSLAHQGLKPAHRSLSSVSESVSSALHSRSRSRTEHCQVADRERLAGSSSHDSVCPKAAVAAASVPNLLHPGSNASISASCNAAKISGSMQFHHESASKLDDPSHSPENESALTETRHPSTSHHESELNLAQLTSHHGSSRSLDLPESHHGSSLNLVPATSHHQSALSLNRSSHGGSSPISGPPTCHGGPSPRFSPPVSCHRSSPRQPHYGSSPSLSPTTSCLHGSANLNLPQCAAGVSSASLDQALSQRGSSGKHEGTVGSPVPHPQMPEDRTAYATFNDSAISVTTFEESPRSRHASHCSSDQSKPKWSQGQMPTQIQLSGATKAKSGDGVPATGEDFLVVNKPPTPECIYDSQEDFGFVFQGKEPVDTFADSRDFDRLPK